MEANYFRRYVCDFQELVSIGKVEQEDGLNNTWYRQSRNWVLTDRALTVWMTESLLLAFKYCL